MVKKNKKVICYVSFEESQKLVEGMGADAVFEYLIGENGKAVEAIIATVLFVPSAEMDRREVLIDSSAALRICEKIAVNKLLRNPEC